MSDKETPLAVPTHLELKKDTALTVTWSDGTTSCYPIDYLRKMSPSADSRQLREELKSNPLAILPADAVNTGKPLTIERIERVGNYAVRLVFSDGHDVGIYSWKYLWSIDPG